MIKTFINTYKVTFAEEANTFIYYLKKIPFLGKKISDNLYSKTNIKITLGVISEVFKFAFGFIGKIIYTYLMIMLPIMLLVKEGVDKITSFLHIFFFLSLVIGSLMDSIIFDVDKTTFNMIKLMRAQSREYYLGQIIYKRIVTFIFFIPALMMIGLPFLKVIILMLEFTAIRIISNYLELCFYNKRKVILSKNGCFLVITVLSGLLLAYLLPYLGYVIDFNNILFNKAIILSIVLLGIVAFIRLYKYKHYNKVAKEYIKKEKVFINDGVMEDINFSTVKIDETKIDKNDLVSNIYEDKEGYEYLNSLFFLRHKNIMINSIKHIGIVIGIIFISIIVFIIFKPNVRPIVVKTFINSAPLMVFIMYTISTTERICKAMFYNCDKSLLRYSYYRNEKVILANFTSRLKKVMSINIIPAIELSLAFIIITICCGQPYSIIKVIPTCICIICLSGFFSIHHLFMYYVIQPYTAELTIKSPLFKTVNMVMYFLSYMCLRLKTSSYYFTIGVIITTIIYMIIALIVIYRVAPKTFKLK